MTQPIAGEEFFAPDKKAITIYRALARSLLGLEGVEVVASKSQLAFRARRGFAYAWSPKHYLKSDVPVVVSLALREEAPPIGTSRGDANPASREADDVSDLQLPSAAAINLAVHDNVALDDGLFHVSTGVEESSELQELPEANDLTADRDVVDRSRVRHAPNVSRPGARL